MNQFLIDTNVVIWLADGNPRIDRIKPLLFSRASDVFISAVSWWEMAIKIRSGKLPVNLEEIRAEFRERGFRDLPVTGAYIDTYLGLPRLHRDPFDLMLLAQAITAPMFLITGDALLAKYSPLVIAI